MSRPYTEVLVRPILTEKATSLRKNRTYVFEVVPDATKPEVKSAVEKAFGVVVERVHTMNRIGKMRRVRVVEGQRKGHKRALVTITEKSKKIDFFEGLA